MKPSITVCGLSVNYYNEQFAQAVEITSHALPGSVTVNKLLITDRAPDWAKAAGIKQEQPAARWYRPNGTFDFNSFLVHGLNEHIGTNYVITVHDDGYASHPQLWRDDFLSYDYIGAPWPMWLTAVSTHGPSLTHRVGNGGFSLQSKRFLQWQASLPNVGNATADCYVCRTHRRDAERAGLRYAPLDIACSWAFELPLGWRKDHKPSRSFGFHGNHTPETEQLCLVQRKNRWKWAGIVSRISRFLP